MEMLLNTYNNVFDTDGNVKLCGREACKELILAMRNHFQGEDFGNLQTGMMNVDKIREYMSKAGVST